MEKCPNCDAIRESLSETICAGCGYEFKVQSQPFVPQNVPLATNTFKKKQADVKAEDLAEMSRQCKVLISQDYKLYAIFGNSESGKSCFLYALSKLFEKGKFGFSEDGINWRTLKNELEVSWNSGKETGTSRGFWIYKTKSNRKGMKNIAFIDIAGEQFQSLHFEHAESVLVYLTPLILHCHGYFMFLNLKAAAEARNMGQLLPYITNFLTISANLRRLQAKNPTLSQLDTLADPIDLDAITTQMSTRPLQLDLPVSLCLTLADELKNPLRFTDDRPGRSMNALTFNPHQISAWQFMEAVYPALLKTLLLQLQKFQVHWVSSLGANFSKDKTYSGSIGVREAFEHVVVSPPGRLCPSTETLYRLSRGPNALNRLN